MGSIIPTVEEEDGDEEAEVSSSPSIPCPLITAAICTLPSSSLPNTSMSSNALSLGIIPPATNEDEADPNSNISSPPTTPSPSLLSSSSASFHTPHRYPIITDEDEAKEGLLPPPPPHVGTAAADDVCFVPTSLSPASSSSHLLSSSSRSPTVTSSSDADWCTKTLPPPRISNKLSSWDDNELLLNIPFQELGAALALGRPLEYLPSCTIPLVKNTFITCFTRASTGPFDEVAIKKALLLPTILFVDGGDRKISNIKDKCNLIQEDDWSRFRVSSFPGRVQKVITRTGPDNEKEQASIHSHRHFSLQKRQEFCLKQVRKWIQKGEIARAYNAWISTSTPAAKNSETISFLRNKHPSRSDEEQSHLEEMAHALSQRPLEEQSALQILPSDVLQYITAAAKGTRYGNDNFPIEIMKQFLTSSGESSVVASPIGVGSFCESLAGFLNRIFTHPSTTLPILGFILGAEITAIQTSPTKLRPIAMGSLYRKLVEKVWLRQLSSSTSAIFDGTQFGVGTKFGSEKMIHLCRLQLQCRPHLSYSASDYKDAFQNVKRSSYLTKAVEALPQLAQTVIRHAVAKPTLAFVGSPDGVQLLQAEIGVQQGSPISPLEFALATQAFNTELFRLAQLEHPQSVGIAYADDVKIFSSLEGLHKVVHHQLHHGHAHGLYLQPGKHRLLVGCVSDPLSYAPSSSPLSSSSSSSYSHSPSSSTSSSNLPTPSSAAAAAAATTTTPSSSSAAPLTSGHKSTPPPSHATLMNTFVETFGIAPSNIVSHPSDGGDPSQFGDMVMGIPVGHPTYVDHQLSSIMEHFTEELDRLLEIPDPQLLYIFMRYVVPHKLTHLLRGLLPSQSRPLVERLEQWQRKAICHIANLPAINDNQFFLARLKQGASLGFYQDIIEPAYVSSFIAALPELQRHFPSIVEVLLSQQQQQQQQQASTSPTPSPLTTPTASMSIEGEDDKEMEAEALLQAPAVIEFLSSVFTLQRSEARVNLSSLLKCQDAAKLQKSLSARTKQLRQQAFKTVTSPTDELRVLMSAAEASDWSTAWLRALPKSREFTLAPHEFSTAFARRLGLLPAAAVELFRTSEVVCDCGCRIENADHMLRCQQQRKHIISNHDTMKEEISVMVRNCGLRVKVEDRHILRTLDPQENSRPDIVVHIPGRPDIIGDVAITTVEANKVEAIKRCKYKTKALELGLKFLPLVFQTDGVVGKGWIQFCEEIISQRLKGTHVPSEVILSYWTKRISIILQRLLSSTINLRLANLVAKIPPKPSLRDAADFEEIILDHNNLRLSGSVWGSR